MEEKIIGFTGRPGKLYHLIFTTRRVIFARASSFREHFGKLPESPGLIQKSGSENILSIDLSRYSPSDILASDEDNYEIPYSDITKVKLRGVDAFRPIGTIIIHTPAKKFKFAEKVPREVFERYRELIKEALPDKYVE
ncbi:MAG: hypothetical protein ACE5LC_07910 [Candidatus Aminicenantales bacterium]